MPAPDCGAGDAAALRQHARRELVPANGVSIQERERERDREAERQRGTETHKQTPKQNTQTKTRHKDTTDQS